MHGSFNDATGPTLLFGPTTDATVGKMRLDSLRECGRVVDFNCVFANEAAARLMCCEPRFLLGKGLCEIVVGPLEHPALIERYRHVVEHGNTQSFEQVHAVGSLRDIVIHRVSRVGDGVEVTLTNRSAARRSRAAALELQRQPLIAQGQWA